MAMDPQVNIILDDLHGILFNMIHSENLDGKNDLDPAVIKQFITDAAWAIYFIQHTIWGFSQGAAVFG